jgi:acyl-CoA thioesterase-1
LPTNPVTVDSGWTVTVDIAGGPPNPKPRGCSPHYHVAAMKTALLIPMFAALALAQQRAADTRPVVLAFGDSLTSGFGVPAGRGYPERLQEKLDAGGYSYRVVNMGVPGDTSASARARMTRAISLTPAMVILELGGNDRPSGLTSAQTRTNLEGMIQLFRKAGAVVVLAQVDEDLKVVSELARSDGLTLIPSFLGGVEDNPKLLIADGLHPNAEGYAIVANTVMKAIGPLLEKQAQR